MRVGIVGYFVWIYYWMFCDNFIRILYDFIKLICKII